MEKDTVKEEVKQEQPQVQEAKGWGKVHITLDMPVGALFDFFNVLNQRLCTVENLVTIEVEGQKMTLTDVYEAQAKAAQEKKDGE